MTQNPDKNDANRSRWILWLEKMQKAHFGLITACIFGSVFFITLAGHSVNWPIFAEGLTVYWPAFEFLAEKELFSLPYHTEWWFDGQPFRPILHLGTYSLPVRLSISFVETVLDGFVSSPAVIFVIMFLAATGMVYALVVLYRHRGGYFFSALLSFGFIVSGPTGYFISTGQVTDVLFIAGWLLFLAALLQYRADCFVGAVFFLAGCGNVQMLTAASAALLLWPGPKRTIRGLYILFKKHPRVFTAASGFLAVSILAGAIDLALYLPETLRGQGIDEKYSLQRSLSFPALSDWLFYTSTGPKAENEVSFQQGFTLLGGFYFGPYIWLLAVFGNLSFFAKSKANLQVSKRRISGRLILLVVIAVLASSSLTFWPGDPVFRYSARYLWLAQLGCVLLLFHFKLDQGRAKYLAAAVLVFSLLPLINRPSLLGGTLVKNKNSLKEYVYSGQAWPAFSNQNDSGQAGDKHEPCLMLYDAGHGRSGWQIIPPSYGQSVQCANLSGMDILPPRTAVERLVDFRQNAIVTRNNRLVAFDTTRLNRAAGWSGEEFDKLGVSRIVLVLGLPSYKLAADNLAMLESGKVGKSAVIYQKLWSQLGYNWPSFSRLKVMKLDNGAVVFLQR